MKRNILWKYDKILGVAYFCPKCKLFLCSGSEEKCHCCGQEIDWQHEDEYKGSVKWMEEECDEYTKENYK